MTDTARDAPRTPATALRRGLLRRAPCTGLALLVLLAGCASAAPAPGARPAIVPHRQWEDAPPLGHDAEADRRNLAPGDTFAFRALRVTVAEVGAGTAATAAAAAASPVDSVRLVLALDEGRSATPAPEERWVAEGAAFDWRGYRVAVLAVRAPGELGGGLTSLEVATVASLPPEVAASDSAGGAALRLRIPHRITHITLHHSGSAEPLRPEDDVVEKLRALQRWGAADRSWWDVPYHFLIGLDGTIYEGRDWRYMGETNTRYDPRGHLLISVVGNYALQEPTPAQLDAIADLMAWGVAEFGVPLERIGGHYDYAETTCPGPGLVRYLEDGTFRRLVEARLGLPAVADDPPPPAVVSRCSAWPPRCR